MNIQLRDSKTLQDGLYKESKRNALPRAQLHPELQEPHLVTESGGFIIRSDNAIDIKHMGLFLAAPSACSAAWTMSGKGASSIASELVFTFDAGGKIAIRTQAVGDVTRLTSIIPSDRTARFSAQYDDGQITMVRASTDPQVPSSSKSEGELQIEAAKAGVKWDKKASRETMIERIEAAKTAKV